MANINNFGGGIKTPERPVEYYKIIDDHKKEVAKISPTTKNQNFAKVLANTKTKAANEHTKLTPKKENTNTRNPQAINANKSTAINGTDLARMKNVSKQLTDQFYGFLWAQMAEGVNQNPEGGFGEAIFQKSLWPELVKAASGNELDEVGKAILRDLIRQQEHNVK
ncbi:MAG: hypothetical protein Tsb006_1120 [Rickettsiaceae bacterium]